jgi:Kef-type K+ transport system membrane component KefB
MRLRSAFSFLPDWPLTPDAVFWAGLALFIAGFFGELAYRAWRVPRITTYSVIGLMAGAFGFGTIDASTSGNSRLVIDVALGLLLFELGSRLDLRWIRRNPWLIVTSLTEATLTFALVSVVLLALNVPAMVALVIAAISVATSPAMVIQLKTELHAEGQVSQRMVTLSALNSVYAVVLAKLLSSWQHQEAYGNVLATIFQPIYLLCGSAIVGYLFARACRFLSRQIAASIGDDHSFVALFGLVILAIAVAETLKLPTVLTLLTAGIFVKNLDQRPQLWPEHFGTAGWLLTVVLFVLAVTSLERSDLALGGLAAVALIAARGVAKLIGVLAFAKPSGINLKQGLALGVSLAPMSALAYLLVDDTYQLYPNFDPRLHAIVICAVGLLQLASPLWIHAVLTKVGEVRRDDA